MVLLKFTKLEQWLRSLVPILYGPLSSMVTVPRHEGTEFPPSPGPDLVLLMLGAGTCWWWYSGRMMQKTVYTKPRLERWGSLGFSMGSGSETLSQNGSSGHGTSDCQGESGQGLEACYRPRWVRPTLIQMFYFCRYPLWAPLLENFPCTLDLPTSSCH